MKNVNELDNTDITHPEFDLNTLKCFYLLFGNVKNLFFI